MRVRALDATGDWEFGKGKNNYKADLAAVTQNIATRLRSFYKDCFFDLPAGIDWFNLLGAKDQLALNLAISGTITSTAFVRGIIQLFLELDTDREIFISYKAYTTFGQIAAGTVVLTPKDYLVTEDDDPLITEDGDKIIVTVGGE